MNDHRYTITKDIAGNYTVTTLQHVITVYDVPTACARVVRNTTLPEDVWTTPDDGTNSADLRALLHGDYAALCGLADCGVLAARPLTVLVAADAWLRADATAVNCATACARAEAYLTDHEGFAFDVFMQPALPHEAAGMYWGTRASGLRPARPADVPEDLREIIDTALIHACETWPEATEA